MQVTAEQTNPCTVELEISLDAQEVARAFDSAYREYGRYVNVPGFRPGKAPRMMLERYMDQEKVREIALEKLVNDSVKKAIQQEGLEPFRGPDVEPTDLEDKKPYTYKAIIPLEPIVTLGDYTGLTVEKPILKITDTHVDEQITRLREERARLDRVTDRGVQLGDVLIAEVKADIEGEEPQTEGRRQLVQMGSGNNIAGFDDALLGMTLDEERVFPLTYPDDYEEEERRGKSATFTVRLSSISAKKLPELTDDFAQKIAGVSTVEELRERILEQLQAETAQQSNEIAEQRLIQQILTNSEVHYPEKIVREQMEEDARMLDAQLQRSSMTYDTFLERNGLTRERHREYMHSQATLQVRALLVLREIARQEEMQASEGAINAEFERLLHEGRISDEQYDAYIQDNRRRFQIANALVQQQLHEFLFANNTVHEVEQETLPDPDEEEAEAIAALEGTQEE